jgi:RNA recognition motif-containing protein
MMHDVPSQQPEDVLSLFVSDLSTHAVEEDIYRLFHFPMEHLPADAFGKVYIYPFNITDVRIVAGDNGNSKYAFVRFPSIAERTRALYIMQGVLCIGRPSQSQFLLSPPPLP